MLRSYTAPLFVQAEISLKMFEVSPLIGFGSVKGWGLKISWWMLKWFKFISFKAQTNKLTFMNARRSPNWCYMYTHAHWCYLHTHAVGELYAHTCKSIQLTEQETRWTITSWMYFLAIGNNLLSAYLFFCCFFKSDFFFQIDVQIHPRLLNFKLIILLVCNKG